MSGPAVRALLSCAIDYAGLFPPASLPMREAVRNYASYRASADAWALARFVVPLSRMREFRDAAEGLLPAGGEPPWRLSALAGAGGAGEWAAATGVCAGLGVIADAVELRVDSVAAVTASASRLPRGLDVFYEIPIDGDVRALLTAIRDVGGQAKVRTGGVTPEAFPTPDALARFIVACAREGVPFKATAGLHHPFRASYRLTYAADAPTGEMFGFLNVLLAAALARGGAAETEVTEMLLERDATAVTVTGAGVTWRGTTVSTDSLAETRGSLARSFGSCSFREPIDELAALGVL